MEPPGKIEVWLGLEPDKLVMQIALATGERADNEIATKPTTHYRSDEKHWAGSSHGDEEHHRIWLSITFNTSQLSGQEPCFDKCVTNTHINESIITNHQRFRTKQCFFPLFFSLTHKQVY